MLYYNPETQERISRQDLMNRFNVCLPIDCERYEDYFLLYIGEQPKGTYTQKCVESHIEKVNEKWTIIYKIEEISQSELEEKTRKIRDKYLEIYIDKAFKNPIQWEDMTGNEKDIYKGYRKYLLKYTENEEWYKVQPLTMEEWKKENGKEA